jgi:hypothetical protein
MRWWSEGGHMGLMGSWWILIPVLIAVLWGVIWLRKAVWLQRQRKRKERIAFFFRQPNATPSKLEEDEQFPHHGGAA